MELVFTLGLTAAALGMAVPAMGGALAALVTPFARWLLWMTRHLADLPFASLSLTSPYLTAWLAFVYGVFLLCCAWRRQRRYVLPVCACVCTLCVCLVLTRLADTAPRLTLVALDVGQGRAPCCAAGRGPPWWTAAAARAMPGTGRRTTCGTGGGTLWTCWC